MNKIIIGALSALIAVLVIFSAILWFKYKDVTATPPDKIEVLTSRLTGTGKLILAEERVYQEYIKNFKKGPAHAQVLFRWLTNFQYLVNLQSPDFSLSRDGNSLIVQCPILELNDPSIDIKTYKPGIVLDGSIWINELKLINDEMTNFKDQSQKAGLKQLNDTRIIKLCKNQLKLAVLKIAAGLQVQVDDIVISFKQPEIEKNKK